MRMPIPRAARVAVLFGLSALVALLALPASGALSANGTQTYIIQLTDQPAVVYEGGISGYPATKPANGKKIDPNNAKVRSYVDYLESTHDAALDRVGGGQKLYDYGFAFNGFSAVLSGAQAEKLEAAKNVVAVSLDEAVPLDTSTTPAFLGLTGGSGFWQFSGNAVGEDVIIGVLDTGFWPEALSYSDRSGTNPNGKTGKKGYQQIPGWHGKCTPGEAFNASMCNQKVIGAQAFPTGFDAAIGIPDFEFESPRDFDGHGTHTSTTAGGNFGVQPTGDAAAFPPISGIAPRARLSIYKVCWELPDQSTANCFSSDRVEAIDQSVADGVDVLNHSIGATLTNFLDPVQVAFFNAAGAGVFVAASAGNSGPGASTVASPGPWTTSVAASTHDRSGVGKVTIDGVEYPGASLAAAETTGVLADGEDSGLAGTSVTSARLCFSDGDNNPTTGVTPVLDPAEVGGKIVLCDRGTNALVDKSFAVKNAGGIGMVLTNVSGGSTTLNALIHSVPTVHVPFTAADYAALHAAADAAETATIAKATIVTGLPAPDIASFSSRGPSQATNGDILKPDISAPGVDVLAAVAPPGNVEGRDFDLLSGTSMSSPHIAGVAALLKGLRPSWSPMAIKSAMMTTAYDLLSVAPSLRPFAQGAGHVDPKRAADPGLVFDSGPAEWIQFICGTGQLTGPLCTTFGTIDPSNLNQASIAIGDLTAPQTVPRTATSVGTEMETYAFSVEGLTGITVTPSVPSFEIAPGAAQPWNVTFTRTGAAPLDTYATGFIKWTGDEGHVVRMPVVIRPASLIAPAEVTLDASNAATWSIKSGVTDTITLGKRGLIPAATDAVTLADDPDDSFDTANPDSNPLNSTFLKAIAVPAGTTVLRGATFDADTDGNDDLDLYLYRVNPDTTLTLVAVSAGATSQEVVTLRNPTAPRTYRLYVHAFDTDGPDVNFTLFNWVLGTSDAVNMTVNGPFSGTPGSTHTVNLTTTGLTPGTRYLGQITYTGTATGPIGTPTIVSGKAS
jgi:subtilisin family serine protease